MRSDLSDDTHRQSRRRAALRLIRQDHACTGSPRRATRPAIEGEIGHNIASQWESACTATESINGLAAIDGRGAIRVLEVAESAAQARGARCLTSDREDCREYQMDVVRTTNTRITSPADSNS